MTAVPAAAPERLRRRVGLSSFVGTTIEYYDFLLYGAAAAVVFNKIFFPALDPVLGTVAALASLAVGYAARLVGGLVCGHFGDRYGRKPVLIVTVVVMGLASRLIGLLPTYQQIGWVAGVLLLLLRVVQGLAVGGEFGGAALMSTEYADPARRGLAGSVLSMGAATGSVLATGTMAVITLLPEADLLSWGWRVPFLFSFVLLLLGLYLRYRISESPVFLSTGAGEAARSSVRIPITTLLRTNARRVLWGIAVAIGPFCGQGVLYIYILTYATGSGYTRPQALSAVTIGTLVSVGGAAAFAALSDRVGRRPVMLYSALATAAVVFPCFWLVNTGNPALLLVAVTVYVGLVMISGLAVMPVLLSELFPADIRYTGVSLAYQVGQMGSGFAPVIAASLLAAAGGGTNIGLVAGFVVVVALGSALAVWRIPETRAASMLTTSAVDPQTIPSS